MANRTAYGRRTIAQVAKDAAHRALMSDLSIYGKDDNGRWKKLGKLPYGQPASAFVAMYTEAGWTVEEACDDD